MITKLIKNYIILKTRKKRKIKKILIIFVKIEINLINNSKKMIQIKKFNQIFILKTRIFKHKHQKTKKNKYKKSKNFVIKIN